MQTEDYFLFLEPTDIRIKGHRIGIETVLDEYLTRKRSPEEIQCLFPTLTLVQVYATILYYLQNRERIGKYMEDWWSYSRQARENAARNPTVGDLRRMALREEIASYAPEQQDEARRQIIVRENRKQEIGSKASDGTQLLENDFSKLPVVARKRHADPAFRGRAGE